MCIRDSAAPPDAPDALLGVDGAARGLQADGDAEDDRRDEEHGYRARAERDVERPLHELSLIHISNKHPRKALLLYRNGTKAELTIGTIIEMRNGDASNSSAYREEFLMQS